MNETNKNNSQQLTSMNLLSDEEYKDVQAYIKEFGYMPIQSIRHMLLNYNCKTDSYLNVDPSFLLIIDAYIDYPIFFAKNQVFTRQDLMEKFPFIEFNTVPEKIFKQQEIGAFVAKGEKEPQYEMRDISNEPFMSTKDFVKSHIIKGYTNQKITSVKVTTKIYAAKEEWDEFCLMKTFIKGFQNLIPIEGGATFGQAIQALPWFLTSQAKGGQALLTNAPNMTIEAPIEMTIPTVEEKKRRGRPSKPKEVKIKEVKVKEVKPKPVRKSKKIDLIIENM